MRFRPSTWRATLSARSSTFSSRGGKISDALFNPDRLAISNSPDPLCFAPSRTVKPKQVEGFNRRNIVLFSFIFSLNIAMGNTSLRWVSVNFNQVCRALVPVIVMGISMVYYKKAYSAARQWAVVPIVAGVALAFYGDMSFTNIGAFYTMLCVVLAALKAIVGGELLTGDLKLHEIDLLSKVCPLALLQIGAISLMTGEVSEICGRWKELSMGAAPQVVLLSGLLSFSLNVSNFIANKVTSPLTLCIAANVKQVCPRNSTRSRSLSLFLCRSPYWFTTTLPSPRPPNPKVLLVAFGTVYFGDPVTLMNGAGIIIVIMGSFKYGLVSLQEPKG